MSEIFPTNIDREIDAGGRRRGTAQVIELMDVLDIVQIRGLTSCG